MPKTAVKYIHPKHGEIYIAEGTRARELLDKKQIKELNEFLNTLKSI